jgi:two-component system, cell cycle response regulator DivK
MKTVLVVDDDLDTRHIWQTALEHHGYAVLGAADGPQGVSMAQEHSPDLILMNLSMPTLDGLSATMLLRQDPRTAEIPIIACTGFVREEGEHEAEHAGVDAYLEKPCEPSRMAEAVERMIGPALAPAEGPRIRH